MNRIFICKCKFSSWSHDFNFLECTYTGKLAFVLVAKPVLCLARLKVRREIIFKVFISLFNLVSWSSIFKPK